MANLEKFGEDAPEVVQPEQYGPEVAVSSAPEHFTKYQPPYAVVNEVDGSYNTKEAINWEVTESQEDASRRTVAGLRPRIFWILIAVLVIVLAAAIGGGIAAGLASRLKDSIQPTYVAHSLNRGSHFTLLN
jgi:hypothetical protein